MERIKEIEMRLAEISDELEKDGADLDALEAEVRKLKAEKADIAKKAEQREKLISEVVATGATVRNFEEETNMTEKRSFAVDSAEYRAAFLKNLMGKQLDEEERAAVNATAAIPTVTMNEIVGRLELNPILAAIDLMHIPGNISFPAEGTVNDAAWTAMGTAATNSADTLTSVSLAAYKLIKTVEITADVDAMSIDAFESWLVARLGNKLERALSNAVINGTGSGQPTGLVTTLSTATGTFTKTGMEYKDLMDIIAALPTAYLPGAKFVVSRTLFFGEILGMETTSGEAVIVADVQSPAKYNVLGFPVIIDDAVNAGDIYFGDLKEYKMNFAKDPEITSDTSVGFRTGSTVYRAMCLADGKLVDSNSIVRYKRASA